MTDVLVQTCIALTGVLSAWVNQSRLEATRRWGCILGLLAQPFWFASAISAHQWGVLACSVGYTFAFARGVKLYWLSNAQPRNSN